MRTRLISAVLFGIVLFPAMARADDDHDFLTAPAGDPYFDSGNTFIWGPGTYSIPQGWTIYSWKVYALDVNDTTKKTNGEVVVQNNTWTAKVANLPSGTYKMYVRLYAQDTLGNIHGSKLQISPAKTLP